MKYNEFINSVAERAGISHGQAEDASHAFFEALSMRIGEREAKHLASQLPNELSETVRHHAGHQTSEKAGAFFEKLGADQTQGHEYSQSVWDTLKEAVSKGEINHLRSQLPNDIADILD